MTIQDLRDDVIDNEEPTIEELIAWEKQGGCEATDSCWVEVDGICSHRCESWFLYLCFV